MSKKSLTRTTGLFGMDESPFKRVNARHEVEAFVEVLRALRADPDVCWCERLNTGAPRIGIILASQFPTNNPNERKI
jgi:hypothetical protein